MCHEMKKVEKPLLEILEILSVLFNSIAITQGQCTKCQADTWLGWGSRRRWEKEERDKDRCGERHRCRLAGADSSERVAPWAGAAGLSHPVLPVSQIRASVCSLKVRAARGGSCCANSAHKEPPSQPGHGPRGHHEWLGAWHMPLNSKQQGPSQALELEC